MEKSNSPVLNVACTIGNDFIDYSSHPTLFPYFEYELLSPYCK